MSFLARVVVLTGACLPIAWAQPVLAQMSIAETLYQEGKQLMSAGKYGEACPKLQESYRMEPGPGVLLNLATCNESLGKTATAWSQFSESYLLLSRQEDETRAAYALQHRDALENRLSRISIQVSAPSQVEGLRVMLDGVVMGSGSWGVAVAVDPGPHTIEAHAPGHQSWTKSVTVGATADKLWVDVPTLERQAAAQRPAAAAAAGKPNQSGTSDQEGGRPLTTPVIICGAATVALALGAGLTGAMYLGMKTEFDEVNGQPGVEREEIERQERGLDNVGYVNLALTGAAVVGAGVTVVLYLTTPKRPASTAIVPWFGPDAAGATLLRRF